MKKPGMAALSLFLALALAACSSPAAEVTATPEPSAMVTSTPAPTPEPTPTPDPIGERIKAMSDQELVGQLLVVGIEGTEAGEDARAALKDLRAGGIILFGRNVGSGARLVSLNAALKALNEEAGNPPLFLCVDEEGGNVSRLAPLEGWLKTPYDHIADLGDPAGYGMALAQRCARYGFNVDFAPCLDIWSNPNNTVIAKRAYGPDAETAALAVDAALGMMEEGVVPVGKHFPGHGDTDVDSHTGLPVVTKTEEELEEMELIPFRAAVDRGVPALMVGHILLTGLDPDLPASLSPAVVDGLLREKLGFNGVVFTDDLTMGAVSQRWSLEEAVVLAVRAGCDSLLVCHGADNAQRARNALLDALGSGALTRERVEESVYRILSLKAEFDMT